MTPKEFNEQYDVTYTKHESTPMKLIDGEVKGHWLSYTKQETFVQVNVTKKDDENYWDTYRGNMPEIIDNIIKNYNITYD